MSYVLLEFMCDEHGRFESLEPRATAPDDLPCPTCGASSPWCMSAPMARVRSAELTRGKPEAPPPNACDTRPLAEGMPLHEWKKKRAQQRRSQVHDEVRRMRS